MGKHAQYLKRGTARQAGSIGAPIAGDFTVGTPAVPNTTVTKVASFPSPATQWRPRTIVVSSGVVAYGGVTSGASISAPTAAAATQYRVQVVWINAAGIEISEWFTAGTITTP